MTQQQQKTAVDGSIASETEWVENLYPRQTTIHEWRVLSRRNGSVTAHEVNIQDLTCTCEDMQFNLEGNQVCDHLAAALFQADRTMDVKAALDHEMRKQMLDLKDSVRAIERRAAGVKADVAYEEANGTAEGSDSTADEWTGDPVEEFEALLRDAGLDPDDFEVWVNDQFGSLQVDQDGYLETDEFEDWVDFSNGLDMDYDGDEDVNFLQPERFPEVFG